nr:hypothetical protein [Paracoccus saliphilus]
MKIKWISGVVAVTVAVVSAVSGVTMSFIEYLSDEKSVELDKQSSSAEQSIARQEQQRLFLETFAENVMNGDLRYRRDFAFYVTQ